MSGAALGLFIKVPVHEKSARNRAGSFTFHVFQAIFSVRTLERLTANGKRRRDLVLRESSKVRAHQKLNDVPLGLPSIVKSARVIEGN